MPDGKPSTPRPSTLALETPALALGCSYAMIPRSAILELPPGPLVTLGILASLRRKTRWLTLTGAELAASTGWCPRTVRAHKRELERLGYLRPGTHILTAKAGPGRRFARVDIRRWPVLGAAACRVLAGMSLFTDRRGRLRVSRRYLARLLGCTARTIRRGIRAAREAGLTIAKRLRRGPEKTVRSLRRKLSGHHENVIRGRPTASPERRKMIPDQVSGRAREVSRVPPDPEPEQPAPREKMARLQRQITLARAHGFEARAAVLERQLAHLAP